MLEADPRDPAATETDVVKEPLPSDESPGTDDSAWLEEALARHVRTGCDEFGSFYAWLEGHYGGETLLLWAPRSKGEAVIRALRDLGCGYKGRIVLGLDASPGHGTPFLRALEWVRPRRALVLTEGEGVGVSFTPQAAEAPDAEALEAVAPTGLAYRETPVLRAWEGGLEADLPRIPGPAVGVYGWERGIPTYGVGLVGLEKTLQALLRAWRLNVEEA